jgi:hypothetical protein
MTLAGDRDNTPLLRTTAGLSAAAVTPPLESIGRLLGKHPAHQDTEHHRGNDQHGDPPRRPDNSADGVVHKPTPPSTTAALG